MRISGDNDSIYIFRIGSPAESPSFVPVTDRDVFGQQNSLITTTQTPTNTLSHDDTQPLTGTIGFHLLVILLFISYTALVFAFRGCIGQLMKAMKPTTNPEQSYNEQTMVFRQFINYSSLLAIFTTTIFLSKGAEAFLPEETGQIIPKEIQTWGPLLILAASFIIYGYKYFVVKILRFVTGNNSFFDTHRYIGQVSTATGMFFVTPILILCATGSGNINFALLSIAAGLAIATYLLFSVRSISFFTRKGVFILQWILYLCTVEIFPVSLLIALAVKFNS